MAHPIIMKFPLTYPFRRPSNRHQVFGLRRAASGRAFTLVEILVSLAVLSIIVGMMGTMLSTMGVLWHDAQKRVNNFSKARAMLDMMTHDLQAGVYRSDLSAFSNSAITFYTQRPGVSTSGAVARDVSIVGYDLNNSVLQRSSQVIYWTDSPTSYLVFGQPPPAIPATTPQDAASGVIDFKLLFLHKDGTLTSTYTTSPANPVRAIAITLAVVDDQTLLMLNQTNKAGALYTALEANASLTHSVKENWENYLESGSMNWNGYPKSLGVGLKIFERYVYLPNAS
jgi:prepilin-type N-terminal cleavage/methylation domain-containing protein